MTHKAEPVGESERKSAVGGRKGRKSKRSPSLSVVDGGSCILEF